MKKVLLIICLCVSSSLFANTIPIFEGTYIPSKNISKNMVGTNPNTYTPKYAQIKGFQNCLRTKSMRTWNFWCLPQNKPTKCDDKAWEDLKSTKLDEC